MRKPYMIVLPRHMGHDGFHGIEKEDITPSNGRQGRDCTRLPISKISDLVRQWEAETLSIYQWITVN
ncbi:uncharacterized protein Dyak_GE29234 [Drosophila yakuba]|uniref:Uncharacterized protein n=1 Tax=Drosophila yakuba TaxID=7245 RepID=A0A0R1DPK2_DROYA|nr:uncharacterized protein Dyak_GE29234 [Drosophila yakuba]